MSNKWRYFYIGYIWSILNTALNLLVAVILYRAHSWEWREGVLTCIGGTKNGRSRILGQPGGQGFGGCLVVYKNEHNRSRADLRVHENCHVTQGLVLGPLFLLLYPLCFSLSWAWRRGTWHDAYMRIPFEQHAYDTQAAYLFTVQTKNATWAESRWGHGV